MSLRRLSEWGLSAGKLGLLLPLLLAVQVQASDSLGHLPKRLVLALDGVGYRDMKALQQGITFRDPKGRQFHRQAFDEGYYPVSRMISTFPSASDVAWTEILGDRPLPGYQRTYFSAAANSEVSQNGITTSMEYERQMTWQVAGGLQRALGYAFPRRSFKYEVKELIKHFLSATNGAETYYALLRSPDDAQHLSADILGLLATLDTKLQELRVIYRVREGHELEILILSDHGNNHAGPAKRVEIRSFLKQAGYRIARAIRNPKDVVLPTAGIESWVEVHNAPTETARLLGLLSHLEGVDILTARHPELADQFLVMNSSGELALVEWNAAKNSFRYSTRVGDPLDYCPVVESLARKNLLDSDGFASADAWMAETLMHHYPLALERIVRGHTRGALNPATILISLDNAYVHAGSAVKMGSEFVRFGGTHGALDDINSNGILMSNFAPTQDTSANRVGALFDGFPGVRNYRAEENGAEWVSNETRTLAAVARTPLDSSRALLSGGAVFLRAWAPSFAKLPINTPVEVTVKPARGLHASMGRKEPGRMESSAKSLTLTLPLSFPGGEGTCERVYPLPADWILEPQKEYVISGQVQGLKKATQIFKFAFQTDSRGLPVAN
jgi:hypothetical protein